VGGRILRVGWRISLRVGSDFSSERMYIPSGYRFRPHHEELIDHYLYNKVYGKDIPSEVVLECDIYNDEDLWSKFFKKTRETQIYFFTKLKKKTGKGSRIQRTTAYGTWKEQKDEPIYRDPNKKYHIGSVRTFSFFSKKPNNGRWVMHEYRLDGCLLSNTQQVFYLLFSLFLFLTQNQNILL
jgi:hypothetical protein